MSAENSSKFEPKQLKPKGTVKAATYPALTRDELCDLLATNLRVELSRIDAPKTFKEKICAVAFRLLTWAAAKFDYRAKRREREQRMAEALTAALLSHQKDKLSSWVSSNQITRQATSLECPLLGGPPSDVLAGRDPDQEAHDAYMKRFNYLLSKEDLTEQEKEELKQLFSSTDTSVIVVRQGK